jgi:Glycosyltransferases involved in cell wall biogenesis
MTMTLSIILPARNEARSLQQLLPRLREVIPEAELILVDDGSTDATAAVAEEAGARVIRHPYGMGNGAAIKSGARAATGDILVFMDADGQHDPADIPRLLAQARRGLRHGGRCTRSRLTSQPRSRPRQWGLQPHRQPHDRSSDL